MKSWGSKQVSDTLLWPQENAEDEAFMRPLTKLLQTCQIGRKNIKKQLYQYLFNYWSSPYGVTGISLAQLQFNRTTRAKIPHSPEHQAPINKHKDLANREKRIKERGKEYHEKRNHTKKSKTRVGEHVLVRQQRRNKLTSLYSIHPYTVIDIKDSRDTAQNKKHSITRIKSFIKVFKETTNVEDNNSEENESDLNFLVLIL